MCNSALIRSPQEQEQASTMGQDEADIVLPDRKPYSETMWGTEKAVISPADKFVTGVLKIWDGPVTWFRG